MLSLKKFMFAISFPDEFLSFIILTIATSHSVYYVCIFYLCVVQCWCTCSMLLMLRWHAGCNRCTVLALRVNSWIKSGWDLVGDFPISVLISFSDLTLLVLWQERNPACENCFASFVPKDSVLGTWCNCGKREVRQKLDVYNVVLVSWI